MDFNKCIRCGCFFASESSVCPNCQAKDKVDMNTIQNYLKYNDMPNSVESLASQSGGSLKNISRFMEDNDFKIKIGL